MRISCILWLSILLATQSTATLAQYHEGTLWKRIQAEALISDENLGSFGVQFWFLTATMVVEASDPAADLQKDIDDGVFGLIGIHYGFSGAVPNIVCSKGYYAWNDATHHLLYGDVLWGGFQDDFHAALQAYASEYNALVFARGNQPDQLVRNCKVEKTTFD